MKSKNLKIIVPKGDAFAYETDYDLPKMHQQLLCVGKRGSGKSVAVVNLIKKMNYDIIILISPTAKSNATLLSMLDIDINNCYDDLEDLTIMDQIKSNMELEAEEYDNYHRKMREYKEFLKHANNNDYHLIDDESIDKFIDDYNVIQPPKHKYNGRRPKICCLFDDCLGSQLFSKGIRKLNNWCILHRHLFPVEECGGGALGCSNFFLTQTYTINSGGISKAIRNNCTSLIIFKTKSQKEYKQIEEELAGEIGADTFLKVYEYAVDGDHNFLFVDLHPKEHQTKFRKKFEEYIDVNNL